MGTPFPVATEDQLSPAARSIEEIQRQIIEMRNEPPPVYTPPPVPQAIAEKTRLEIEEGKRRNALALAERNRARPQPKADPTEGKTEPVYRPGDFIPNVDQGQVTTKSYKVL
jgi:hypothetical protein